MTKIQLDLPAPHDRKLALIKASLGLPSKAEAVKHIIEQYVLNIDTEGNTLGVVGER